MVRRDEMAWMGFNQQQQLAAADDSFGCSVSISGETAIVGAPQIANSTGDEVGAAYVYVRRDAKWVEQQILTASVAAADDCFGASVSLDGDTAIIGAYMDRSDRGANCGAVYVFTRANGKWSEQQKLTTSAPTGLDRLGRLVSLSGTRLSSVALAMMIMERASVRRTYLAE